jgi:phosphopantothenate---cysteine ligase (CTP)
MRCIVTAGPTYEPLDKVRRLTNFSTGQLGSELASFLTEQGHEVTLLLGQLATYHGIPHAQSVQTFSTTKDLRDHLRALGGDAVDAVFHAAAVSDFTFGKIWSRSEQGQLSELTAGKLSTRAGTLLAELLPTPKIISQLREFFPKALLVGWKYEVDGDRANLIRLAQEQMASCRTDVCVANGPAYGPGFGLVQVNGCTHHEMNSSLFAALGTLVRQPVRRPTHSIV